MSSRDAWHRESSTVTCIACGASVARSDAREYDKLGDRWDRADKSFEFLCKPCDRERCHSPRDGLEQRLVRAAAETECSEGFVARYLALADADGISAGEE